MNWQDYQTKWRREYHGEPLREPWASIVSIAVVVIGVGTGLLLAVCTSTGVSCF